MWCVSFSRPLIFLEISLTVFFFIFILCFFSSFSVNPMSLDDPDGDPGCQSTPFRIHFDDIFGISAKKPSKEEDRWKRHVLDRDSRTTKSACQGKMCETKSPPNALFVEALQCGWPEQDVDAQKMVVKRRSAAAKSSGMKAGSTSIKKKKRPKS